MRIYGDTPAEVVSDVPDLIATRLFSLRWRSGNPVTQALYIQVVTHRVSASQPF